MNVTADCIALTTNHHKDFCVNLKIYKTINYSNAGLLQLVRPGNVTLFIKAGLKLNEYYNLFTALGRTFKRINNRRIAAGTIQSHFDCQNIVIISCIRNKLYDRIVTLVRNVKDFIMQLKRIPVRLFFRKISRIKMLPLFKAQSRAFINVAKLHQISRINNLIYRINIVLFKLQLFHQEILNLRACRITGHLNRERRLSLNQNIFHRVNKVLACILVYGKVCIAGNFKEKSFFNLKAREKLCTILRNNILKKGKLTAAAVASRKPVNIRNTVRNFSKGNSRQIITTFKIL